MAHSDYPKEPKMAPKSNKKDTKKHIENNVDNILKKLQNATTMYPFAVLSKPKRVSKPEKTDFHRTLVFLS